MRTSNGIGALVCLAAALVMPVLARGAAVAEIRVGQRYLGAGESTDAAVVLDLRRPAPAGARVRVTEVRQVDVPADAAGKAGEQVRTVVDRPVAAGADVSARVDSAGMLAGTVRVSAEIVVPGQRAPLSVAWSDVVTVGLRRRVSLAGEWDVTKVEAYDYKSQHRPKTWKAPELKTARLPGAIFSDEWLRGWVTVRRSVEWAKAGELRPRFVRLSGVADSAQVSIDGVALPETRAVEEMAVLSHWPEFHSPYKGEENAKTRMLFFDLPAQGPQKIALPQNVTESLAGEGKANVEIRVRGTSGTFKPRPMPGITGDLHLEMAGPVFVKDVSFDTDKPGENRRFKFAVVINNDSGRAFRGTLRGVYGRYDGKVAYTGTCPAVDVANQAIELKAGENVVEVVREERPRFDTCRATFLIVDEGGKVVDGDGINYHTVTMEIRDRRDFYLNNERFILKAQGSSGDAPHKRFQLRVMGGNGFRGPLSAEESNLYQSEGLLTSAGPLVASVEKCMFYNPADTSNITKAVRMYTDALKDCPGVVIWEATNELHGEPEEARVAVMEAFHKLDPYHRPVLATKGSGEWEAEARDGRVKGVDVVGCQYLLSKEGVDSIAAAVTEQPIMSTEVNWNDASFAKDDLWRYWLDHGVAGSLLFDYSGHALDQPTPAVPAPDNDKVGSLIKKGNRDLYQDLVASAVRQGDGRVVVRLGNQMPYALRQVSVRVRGLGRVEVADLEPGAAVNVTLAAESAPAWKEPVVVRVEYVTHGGLAHVAILTPAVAAVPGGGK